MAERQVPEGGIIQTLEVPLKESKEGVFTAYLRNAMEGSKIIASIENSDTDNRINELVYWMIHDIPNIKTQEKLRNLLEEKTKKALEEADKSGATNQEKGAIRKRISMEIRGHIAAYMDQYAGGERENRLSFIIPDKKLRAWIQEHNPEHFEEHRKKDGV